ncbi:MAG: hypothetical protein EBU30_06415 [Synechococcaceae bacterium WB6_3B_236]|nr:hypothetical protein [Synechococcaceae bacterium WB6_3B_236]
MNVGEVFIGSLGTGMITASEVNWVADHQNQFNRTEEATAIRLGRLMDQGVIQLTDSQRSLRPLHTKSTIPWSDLLGRR